MRLLLVEDNHELAETILARLRRDGYIVDHEYDGQAATMLIRHESFDLIILDINLPSVSGFDILKDMRHRGDDTPVLLLTARSQVDDRILGLDSGADDYMVKPFDYRELAARCRVLARRRSGMAKNELRLHGFFYDRAAKRAFLDNHDLDLRQKEILMLEYFLDHQGHVIAKEDIVNNLYTFDEMPSLNAVEQIIARLRKKLENTPIHIKTIRGLGYIANIHED